MSVCQLFSPYRHRVEADKFGFRIYVEPADKRVTIRSTDLDNLVSSFLPEIRHPLYHQPPVSLPKQHTCGYKQSSYAEYIASFLEKNTPKYPYIASQDRIELVRILNHEGQILIMLLTDTHFVSIHTIDGQYYSSGHLSGRNTGYDETDQIDHEKILLDVQQREYCIYFNGTKLNGLCGLFNNPHRSSQGERGPTGCGCISWTWSKSRPEGTHLFSYQNKYAVWNDQYIIMAVRGGLSVYDILQCRKVTTIITGSTMISSISVSNHQDWSQAKILCLQEKCWCSLECWSTQGELDFVLSHPIETSMSYSGSYTSIHRFTRIYLAEFNLDNKYIWTYCDEYFRLYDSKGNFIQHHRLRFDPINRQDPLQSQNMCLTTSDGKYQLILNNYIHDEHIHRLCQHGTN